METPSPNDSLKASLSPPVGGLLRSFRRRLTNKQMFIQRVTHYHQWLHTAIHFRTKSGQIPSDSVRIQGPSKRPRSGHLYPVSSVKNAIERVVNVKSLRFYSHLFLVPKPHPRWRLVIDLSRLNAFLHVDKFEMETPEYQDLPDSRVMGIIDRPIGRLPSHPHPPKLKEIPKVLPQVAGVPVHLPPLQTSQPPGLYNDCK